MAQKFVSPTRVLDPHIKRIRAQRIVKRKLDGYSTQQLADEFGVQPITIQREFKYAKEIGLLDTVERQVLQDLAPLAINVYRKKLLEDEDAFVAKDVLAIMTKLGDRQAKTNEVTQTFTVEDYIRARQQPVKEIQAEPLPPTALPGEVLHENDPGEQAE